MLSSFLFPPGSENPGGLKLQEGEKQRGQKMGKELKEGEEIQKGWQEACDPTLSNSVLLNEFSSNTCSLFPQISSFFDYE